MVLMLLSEAGLSGVISMNFQIVMNDFQAGGVTLMKDIFLKRLGQKIKRMREEADVSMSFVSHYILDEYGEKVSTGMISQMESGKHETGLFRAALVIAAISGVEKDDFAEFERDFLSLLQSFAR
tara:strand:+ start:2721 stop:3092 length:372 start_codon:yes stop_codon:yes gene_type:complete